MGCLCTCLSGIAKYLLFFFNFLIVICGIILITIGSIIVHNEHKGIKSFTDISVGGFAIAVGVIIFAIAFFGCCGAIKENSCMLLTYAIILIVLLILQVVFGVFAFLELKNKDGKLDKKVNKDVQETFDKVSKDPNNKDNKKVIDDVQQSYKCCGIDKPSDWTTKYHIKIPDSCYENKDATKKQFKTGCAKAFQDSITRYIKAIGIVAIGFAVVELVGACFAIIVKNRK